MTSKQNQVDFGKATVKATSFSPAISVVAADVEAAIAAKDEVAALSALGASNLAATTITLSTTNTYTDAAVKSAVDTGLAGVTSKVETRLDALDTKVDAIIAALKA